MVNVYMGYKRWELPTRCWKMQVLNPWEKNKKPGISHTSGKLLSVYSKDREFTSQLLATDPASVSALLRGMKYRNSLVI